MINLLQNFNNSIFLLDIDNTLLEPQNLHIYYEKEEIKYKYSPEEYALIDITAEEKRYYNYSDFQDPRKIKYSIETSKPLYKTLNLIENYLEKNKNLGILTARGQETLISNIIPKWLRKKIKNKFKMKREDIHAINDEYKKYKGLTDPEKKLNVLKKYIKNKKYEKVLFIDDNKYTIDLIKKYNKTVKKKERIITIYVTWKK